MDEKADLKQLEEQPTQAPAPKRTRRQWKAAALFVGYFVCSRLVREVLHAWDDDAALQSGWAYNAFKNDQHVQAANKVEQLYL